MNLKPYFKHALMMLCLCFSSFAGQAKLIPLSFVLGEKQIECDVVVEFEHEFQEIFKHVVGQPTTLKISFVNKDGSPFYPNKELIQRAIWHSHSSDYPVAGELHRPFINIVATQSYSSKYGAQGKHWRSVAIPFPQGKDENSMILNVDEFWGKRSSERSMYGDHGTLRDLHNLFDEKHRESFHSALIPLSLDVSYGASGPYLSSYDHRLV